jgi:hypothetical protein
MLALMTTTKTVRLTTEQAAWLAQTSTTSGISENRIVSMLIDRARAEGLRLTVTLGSEPPEHPYRPAEAGRG